MPSTDTYIEKESTINDEIDRLRHSATAALLTRRDVIIVASVSAIYGLGSPEQYEGQLLRLVQGVQLPLDFAVRRLVDIQYERNEVNLIRGRFRVRGDTLEVFPSYEETVYRIEYFGDEVERILQMNPVTGEVIGEQSELLGAPGHPLRHRAGTDAEGHRRHRGRAGRAVGGARAARQAARGPTAAHADQLRPRDDARDRDVCRDRELLAPSRRATAGAGPVHAARLLPRRLPHRPRREPRHHPPDPRPVRRGSEQEGRAGRARLPAAQRRRQPAAHLRGVVPAHRHRRCSCRPPPPPGRSSTPPRSSSRSSAPPGWSTLRWW